MRFTFFAVALLLVLAACTYSVDNDTCTGASRAAERDNCYRDLALEMQNAKVCSLIESESIQESCSAEIAIAARSAGDCPNDYCRSKILIAGADESACSTISDAYWQNNCYRGIAVAKGDFRICMQVTNTAEKDSCYDEIARATLQAGSCALISDVEALGKCLLFVAEQSGDANICHEFANTLDRDTCTLRVAKHTKNTSLCEGISIVQIKENCENSS